MTVMATNEFAVIKTGGKQYKVAVGDVVSVEKMKGTFAPGDKVVFEDVLMYDNGTTSKIGAPTLAGAKVEAVFQKEGRSKKVMVVQYKSKSRHFIRKGHRQPFNQVKISAITA